MVSRFSNDSVAPTVHKTPTWHCLIQSEQRCGVDEELEAGFTGLPGSHSLKLASPRQNSGLHPAHPHSASPQPLPSVCAHVSLSLGACRGQDHTPSSRARAPLDSGPRVSRLPSTQSPRPCRGPSAELCEGALLECPQVTPQLPTGSGSRGPQAATEPRAAGAPPQASVNAAPCGPAQRPRCPGTSTGGQPWAIWHFWPSS